MAMLFVIGVHRRHFCYLYAIPCGTTSFFSLVSFDLNQSYVQDECYFPPFIPLRSSLAELFQ